MGATVERYLLLGLRLGRHVEGLVDAYYGPAGLATRVEGEELVTPAALVEQADALVAELEDGWLGDQARGLRTYAGLLAGEELSYSDEVERCYGLRPEPADEASYAVAHARLDELLPAGGSLFDRYTSWRETEAVPADRIVPLVADVVALLRNRAEAIVPLPEGETLHLEAVHDEPWWAFNYYEGGLRSRVVVNVDVLTTTDDLVELAAHEVYPGHHTERSVKEQRLIRDRGLLEESIQLVPTPQSLVGEGIAETGPGLVLDDGTRAGAHGGLRSRRPALGSTPRLGDQGGANAASPGRPRRGAHAPRGRGDGGGGGRTCRALGVVDAQAGGAERSLRHRPDLAGVRDHVLGRPQAVRRLRRRRPGPLPHPADRAGARRRPAGGGIVRPVSVAAQREYGLFVDGESAEGSETRELVEPATGEPLATVQLAGEADVDRAVAAARAALDGPWGKTPPTERSRLLHALADAIVANRKELAELETRNVGKAISSVKAELAGAAENFRFYASAIATIAGRSNPIGGSLLFYSLKEPVGVAGQIVPWNYPVLMTTWKLAPALAAGCSVVLKPDPQTPLSALRLAELAAEVGFPAGAINIVPGDGPTTGAYLVRHPGVDKVAFTGSTKTGAEIMRLAADPLKRLTLELGGKSPNLVFADANLADAIPSTAWSIYYAAGQSCEARSRVLVEKPLYDDVVAQLAELAGKVKVGDPLDGETQMGSLISGPHRDRVHGFVSRGLDGGAEIVAGGELPEGPGAFYPPTVVAGIDNSAEIAQEEVFGPVVTVIPFEDEADAVRIANDVRYGLMATVWTGDPARGHRLAARIKSGTVGINMPFTAFPGIPFGGYKQSGFGRELGIETLELYLETKSVIVGTGSRPLNPFGL